jgi:hypothetical protein
MRRDLAVEHPLVDIGPVQERRVARRAMLRRRIVGGAGQQ